MKIEILSSKIFDKSKIISGVTLANFSLFPEGFSIFPGKVLNEEQVENFRNILAENLNVARKDLIFQKQIHEDTIQTITEHSEVINYSDGMITNIKGIVLNVTIADCVGILVYDSVNDAIGAFHSGWRGTVLNIARSGILKLTKEYGTNPQDLRVWLSPAAGKDLYEVGREVADLFPDTVKKAKGEKFLLDVRGRIKEQLIELGVKAENIDVSDICTISDKNYHSYRRDSDASGRMSAFIGMAE